MPTPKAEYQRLEPMRVPYDRRAEEAAALTIPSVFPREGQAGADTVYAPYQSVGAEGVANLAAVFSLGLMPPSIPFFRLQMDPELKAQLREAEQSGAAEGALSETQDALSLWEKTILRDVDRANYRTPGDHMLRLLIVSGNALVELLKQGGQRTFSLRSYVAELNPDGSPFRVVLKEEMRRAQLPEEVVTQAKASKTDFELGGDDQTYALYTMISWAQNRYEVQVALEEVVLEGDRYAYEGKAKDCPFLLQHFNLHEGEHYGRGLADEYIGALRTVETLTQAVTQAAAAAAKVVFLVRPGSTTNPRTLSRANNLDFKSGVAEDITVLQVGKYADMRTAEERLNKVTAQLERIFLIGSVRDAERVTTAEIRYLQEQTERRHPGLFPRMSNTWQGPVVRRHIKRLSRTSALPPLPESVAEPVIVTGAAALGRSTEAQKIVAIMGEVGSAFGQQSIDRYYKGAGVVNRLHSAEGVDPTGLLRTQEEIDARDQQEMQARVQAEAQAKAAAKAVDVVGDVAKEQFSPNGQQQPQPETAA